MPLPMRCTVRVPQTGVVFVTTKKGTRNQKANIMFEAKWGWNQQGIKEHETMQNPGDYYEYVYGGLYNYFEANNPGASHAALANAANSNLMPVLGNYMAYKIPDGTTLIDPATGSSIPTRNCSMPTTTTTTCSPSSSVRNTR